MPTCNLLVGRGTSSFGEFIHSLLESHAFQFAECYLDRTLSEHRLILLTSEKIWIPASAFHRKRFSISERVSVSDLQPLRHIIAVAR